MDDRDNEEAVAVVGHTGEGVVPRGEGRQETEKTTSFDDGRVGLALGVAVHVTNTKQQEGDVKEKEDRTEGHGRLESAEEQQRGEDKPTLARSQRDGMRCPKGTLLTHKKRENEL